MSMLGGPNGGGPSASILGTIGAAIGGIGGFFTGGPGGAVAGATAGREIGDAVSGPSGGPQPPNPAPYPTIGGFGFPPGGGLMTPFGGIGTLTNPTASPNGAVPCGVKGYHWNKHPLGATKGGCGRTAHGFLPKHSLMVRNRHMNPGNSRAAVRAIHRLKSAHRIFKKIDKIVGRHHRAAPRRAFGRK